jgi:Lipocalin-like domain
MKRRNLLSVSGMTLLVCSVLASNAVAQQKTLKEQLVGAWTLVSFDVTAKDGTKRQDFGANPKGILILDTSGRYAQVQSRPDRPKFKAGGNFRETPAAEFAEAARAFGANFGTWSVNEADKTLIRKFEGALIPNVESQETKYSISLAGNELKLVRTSATGVRTEEYKR